MKLLFLVFHNLVAHSGISKKIYAQCSALKENGVMYRYALLKSPLTAPNTEPSIPSQSAVSAAA